LYYIPNILFVVNKIAFVYIIVHYDGLINELIIEGVMFTSITPKVVVQKMKEVILRKLHKKVEERSQQCTPVT